MPDAITSCGALCCFHTISKPSIHLICRCSFAICQSSFYFSLKKMSVILFFVECLCFIKSMPKSLAGTLCGMTCMHASVSRSPMGHGLVAPDKRHCRQWMSSLFCGFLPYSFIHNLFLWRTSQEFVKTDLYPLSLMSLRYAVCSTGRWLIIGRCFGACQWSSCAALKKDDRNTKTSHLIFEMSMNEAFIWLSGLHFIDKKNY